MIGYVIECVPKRNLDFGSLPNGAQQEVVLADRIDIVHWSEVTMAVRVHSHALNTGGGSIVIGAYRQSLSDDEPAVAFLDVSSLCSISLTPGSQVSAFFTIGLNAFWPAAPPMIRIVAQGLRSSGPTLSAAISVQLSAKDA